MEIRFFFSPFAPSSAPVIPAGSAAPHLHSCHRVPVASKRKVFVSFSFKKHVSPSPPPCPLRVSPTCQPEELTLGSHQARFTPCKCRPASPWWTVDRHTTTFPSPCSPPSAASGQQASSQSSKLCRLMLFHCIFFLSVGFISWFYFCQELWMNFHFKSQSVCCLPSLGHGKFPGYRAGRPCPSHFIQ